MFFSVSLLTSTLLVFNDADAQIESWVHCADEKGKGEKGICKFNGTKTVRYGHGITWTYKEVNGEIKCKNGEFSVDPLKGVKKQCWYKNIEPDPDDSDKDPDDEPEFISMSKFAEDIIHAVNDLRNHGLAGKPDHFKKIKWDKDETVLVTRSQDQDGAINVQFYLEQGKGGSNHHGYVNFDLTFSCKEKTKTNGEKYYELVQKYSNEKTTINKKSRDDVNNRLDWFLSVFMRSLNGSIGTYEGCFNETVGNEGLSFFKISPPEINDDVDLLGISIKIKTADVKHAGTDDDVVVKLNNIRTIPDTAKNDFERGDKGTVYALNSYGIKQVDNINSLVIDHNGTDGWCLEMITLYINEKPVYDREFSPCKWFDDKFEKPYPWSSYTVRVSSPPYTVSSEELHGHYLWREAFENEVTGKCPNGSDLPSCQVVCPDGMLKNSIEECFKECELEFPFELDISFEDDDCPIFPQSIDWNNEDRTEKPDYGDPLLFSMTDKPVNTIRNWPEQHESFLTKFDLYATGEKVALSRTLDDGTMTMFLDLNGDGELSDGTEWLYDQNENVYEILSRPLIDSNQDGWFDYSDNLWSIAMIKDGDKYYFASDLGIVAFNWSNAVKAHGDMHGENRQYSDCLYEGVYLYSDCIAVSESHFAITAYNKNSILVNDGKILDSFGSVIGHLDTSENKTVKHIQ